jgi:hypothetical protein
MNTSEYLVNSTPLEEIYTHPDQPLGRDFECDNFKNIEYNHLSRINISQYCKNILDVMYSQIVKPLKHQYVFIKIQDLKVGDQTSGTGHWHLDSSLNPVEHYENYIFTTGLHNNTEFFKSPMVIKHANSSADFNNQVRKVYRPERDSFILKTLTVYRYNGSNVHRGRFVTVPEKRILIRLSNTDAKLTVYK